MLLSLNYFRKAQVRSRTHPCQVPWSCSCNLWKGRSIRYTRWGNSMFEDGAVEIAVAFLSRERDFVVIIDGDAQDFYRNNYRRVSIVEKRSIAEDLTFSAWSFQDSFDNQNDSKIHFRSNIFFFLHSNRYRQEEIFGSSGSDSRSIPLCDS